MDYSTLCRCCLKVLSQEDVECSSPSTMDKYTFCIQLQTSNEEILPKSFCRTCDNKIHSTHIFIKEAQARNQELLKQISRNNEIKIEIMANPDHGKTLLNCSLKDLLVKSSSRFGDGSTPNGFKTHYQDFLSSKKRQRGRPRKAIEKEIHKGNKSCIDIEKHFIKESNFNNSDSCDEDDIQKMDDDSLEEVGLPKKNLDSWVLEVEPITNTNKQNIKKDSLMPNIKTDDDFEENIAKSKISKSIVTESRSIFDRRPRSNNLQFTCPVCYKICKQCPSFERHLRTHDTGTPSQADVIELVRAKPHECSKCDKRFRFRVLLNRHYESAHSDIRPFACDSCDKTFKRKENLRMHIRTHASKESREKPYKCEQCDKRFFEKKGLTTHMFFHSGERPYSCDYCQKAFQTRQILRQHLNMHEAERPHPVMCDVCGKGFRDKFKLAEHMPKHTGERSFPCGYCSYRGAYSSSLRRHVKLVHKLTGANKLSNKRDSSSAVES